MEDDIFIELFKYYAPSIFEELSLAEINLANNHRVLYDFFIKKYNLFVFFDFKRPTNMGIEGIVCDHAERNILAEIQSTCEEPPAKNFVAAEMLGFLACAMIANKIKGCMVLSEYELTISDGLNCECRIQFYEKKDPWG